MNKPTPQQRYGLGAAPVGTSKPMGGLAQKRKTKAVTVSGKRFADGGKVTQLDQETVDNINGSANAMEAAEASKKKPVERPIPRIEVTAKRMTPAEAKAYDDEQAKRQDANGNEGLGRDTSKEANGSTNASEAVEAARRKNVDREIHRTINGAPIRNPHPANLPVGSGGVRG